MLLELPTREGGNEGKERAESKDGEEKEGHDEDGQHDRGGICNAGGGRGERLDGRREEDGVVDSREPGSVRGERREDGGGRNLSHGHGRGRGRGDVAARRWWLDGREQPKRCTRSHLLDGRGKQEHQEAERGAGGDDDGHGGVHAGGGEGWICWRARVAARCLCEVRVVVVVVLRWCCDRRQERRWWCCGMLSLMSMLSWCRKWEVESCGVCVGKKRGVCGTVNGSSTG